MRKLLFLTTILIPAISFGQEARVLVEAASVWKEPGKELIETVNRGKNLPLKSVLGYWGLDEEGWINLDYTDYFFPDFTETGKLKLKVGIVTENDELPQGAAVIVISESEDYVIGFWRGKAVKVKKENIREIEGFFGIEVLNKDCLLKGDRKSLEVSAGNVLLKSPDGKFIFNGELFNDITPVVKGKMATIEEILKNLNRLIDIFNSAKLSSPLAERLGYYAKLLPVSSDDLEVVNTENGKGIRLKLKYKFFTKEGEPIKGRKTRLFMKKSNFEFWRKLTEELFKSGVNKFVELDILRADGKGSFEKCGFVASSYHIFKEGGLKNWKDFLENSESDLSEDLWFFADQVYERLEDGN